MGVAAQAQGAMLPQRNGGHSSRKCIVDASGVSEKDSTWIINPVMQANVTGVYPICTVRPRAPPRFPHACHAHRRRIA